MRGPAALVPARLDDRKSGRFRAGLTKTERNSPKTGRTRMQIGARLWIGEAVDTAGNQEIGRLKFLYAAELQAGNPPSAERAARRALELLGTSATNAYAIGVAKCIAALALEQQGSDAEGAILLAEARAALAGLAIDPIYHAACRL